MSFPVANDLSIMKAVSFCWFLDGSFFLCFLELSLVMFCSLCRRVLDPSLQFALQAFGRSSTLSEPHFLGNRKDS